MTDFSFNMRTLVMVEGVFLLMQSWFRAESVNRKLAKMNEFHFLSHVSPQNSGQI